MPSVHTFTPSSSFIILFIIIIIIIIIVILIIIIIIILFIIVILIIISFEFDHQYYIAAVIVFCGTFMQAAVYIFLRLDLNHHYHHTLHCQVTIITNVITCIHTGL